MAFVLFLIALADQVTECASVSTAAPPPSVVMERGAVVAWIEVYVADLTDTLPDVLCMAPVKTSKQMKTNAHP